MNRVVKNTIRFLLVTVGIVVLTSVTIDATDTLRGSQSALSILAKKVTEKSCPTGTAEILLGDRTLCMDMYENSVGDACSVTSINTSLDTKKNVTQQDCVSVSSAESSPWTQVTFNQAKELCAKKGMRLPDSEEWYEGVLGTPIDQSCNVDGASVVTGMNALCVSSRGVYDMVGNVWEWVDEEVTDGVYRDRLLPTEGYVTEVDAQGVALETADTPSELYDNDYLWSKETGSFALMRGGYYGSGSDAGVYAVHGETMPSFSSAAIGFRCVTDL